MDIRTLLIKKIEDFYLEHKLPFKNDAFKGYFRSNGVVYAIMVDGDNYTRFMFADKDYKMSPVPLNSIREGGVI